MSDHSHHSNVHESVRDNQEGLHLIDELQNKGKK